LAITNPARPVSFQRRIEDLNPQVIGVVVLRHPKGVAWIVFQFFLVTRSTLNGGFAITKSNLPTLFVDVFVVRDTLPDVASETVNSKVHFAEPDGLLNLSPGRKSRCP